MPRKLRDLRAELQRGGWSVKRQSGTSHQVWGHDLVPDFLVNLAGADGQDAHHYQERDVREGLRRSRLAEKRRKQP